MRFLHFLIIILLIGCSFNNERSVKDHSMYWHKNSAEYKALCIQAYNIARKKLNIELSKDHSNNLAIVVDIDETIYGNNDRIDGYLDASKWPLPLIFRFGLSKEFLANDYFKFLL